MFALAKAFQTMGFGVVGKELLFQVLAGTLDRSGTISTHRMQNPRHHWRWDDSSRTG